MLFPGAVGRGDVFFALIPLLAERYWMTKEEFRQLMKDTYPQAQYHEIQNAGHGPFLERPAEWLKAVSGFLLD